ncbi:MAG TPA: type I phosphomannose isomerase catalytic subunit [Mobilitalea sp.]|nr:type I phosphomannose isomerase catalytic subunit [Mobilitalea sp.]
MKEILFMEPVFKSMIWGGNRLHTEFGYTIPDDHTGECWAISAHPNGDCVVKNGTYQDKSLSWLWKNHREVFGGAQGEVFPLLVKIIDAKADLSIQVHPDDIYADRNEQGALGKTECWYIMDCPEDGNLVIGHNARDKKELRAMIDENRWKELIRLKPIKKGDFLQIEPGTVHAIKEGTMLLETQQSSDITYRLYDYDRLDQGNLRQLHIEQSIDVIRCPHEDTQVKGRVTEYENGSMKELIHSRYYNVDRISTWGIQEFIQDKSFINVSVLEGEGTIDQSAIKKGDHFILPAGYGTFFLEGNLELIISYIN